MIAYSLLLVIVMIFKPTGLMGNYDFSLSTLIGRFNGNASKKTEKEGGKHE